MEINKIAIVHATRGRPKQAVDSAKNLLDNMTSGLAWQYVFSFDEDDDTYPEYDFTELGPYAAERYLPFTFCVQPNRGAVDAMNNGARHAGGDWDVLLIHADDSLAPKGWDSQLKDFVTTLADPVYFVHLSNVINARDIAVVPILSRGLYEKLGHVFFPGYRSMWADNELVAVARQMGVCHETSIDFRHLHPSFGMGHWDETYLRTNAGGNYAQGQALFHERQARNFH